MFERFHEQIKELSLIEKNLQMFITTKLMKNTDAYDDEDVKIVKANLLDAQQERKTLQLELNRRQEIYDTRLLGVNRRLDTREKDFESISKQTFQKYPKTLNYFLTKQKMLRKAYEQQKHRLDTM